jgi:subtilisin family serine protease
MKTFLLAAASLISICSAAQTISRENLQYQGRQDSVGGINLYRAYELLKEKKSHPVIVAVIGGGFDRDHEKLKEVTWTNKNEIPGNGVDDDKNGFVDDVWGWNFLSDKYGNTVTRLQRDVTQIYKLWKDKYDKADPGKLNDNEKEEWAIYQQAKKEWEPNYPLVLAYKKIDNDSVGFGNAVRDIAAHVSFDRIAKSHLSSYDGGGNEFTKAVIVALQGSFFGQPDSIVLRNIAGNYLTRWRAFQLHTKTVIENFDPEYDPLKLVGDDPANPHQKNYGSPYLVKTQEMNFDHDTHIAGIIGAKRNNGFGRDGIADNVQIMMVYASTMGDERDKDVANAIRYAVENGAKVINMSWGKRYSSHKQVVDEAVQYAAEHDVLLVHGAGNDGNNCDSVNYYPSTKFRNGKRAVNLLQVGAVGTRYDARFVPFYSNYGKHTVDLFAPGDSAYGPLTNNQYGYSSGTSNAAPFVVGVAALLKSYFPELTMVEIKNIIVETVYRPDIRVIRPHYVSPSLAPARRQILMSQGELVPFSSLSISGGILDAEAAVKKAMEVTNKKKGF